VKTSQFILDIILPKTRRADPMQPTDDEAGALYSLWKNSPPGAASFSLPREQKHMLSAWKVKGLVDGMADQLRLTDRGRKLIIEMVTSEPNAFSKGTTLSYGDIRSKKRSENERRLMTRKAFNMKRIRHANRSQ
jgi:hypothetical protein